MRALHVILLSVSLCWGLYSDSSPVIKLTASNFAKEVMQSDDLWLVEFYAPWCGHCKNLAPIFEQSARALSGIAKLGAVDMTVDQSVGSPYNIKGFPTLKFFGGNKKSPLDYSGGRTTKDITSYIMRQARDVVDKRLSGKSSDSGSNKSSSSSSSSSNTNSNSSNSKKSDDVIVLTAGNFKEQVLDSKDMWMVEFYAPWCGHCKKLEPEWAKAATMLKGHVKLGKVDATVEETLANRYEVGSYPTIKVFPPLEKTAYEDYNGPREAEGITNVAMAKLESFGVLPEIKQITQQEDLEACQDTTACLVAFLPHIYDSSAIERNRYIEVVQKVAARNRSKPILFLWAQQGDFYKLEEKVGLGSGFPAVIAITLQKKRVAVMRTKYTEEEISSFIGKVISGQYPLDPYQELPKLKKVEKWDGNDQQPEES